MLTKGVKAFKMQGLLKEKACAMKIIVRYFPLEKLQLKFIYFLMKPPIAGIASVAYFPIH